MFLRYSILCLKTKILVAGRGLTSPRLRTCLQLKCFFSIDAFPNSLNASTCSERYNMSDIQYNVIMYVLVYWGNFPIKVK